MRHPCRLAAVLAAAVTGCAAPADDATADLKALQGTWTLVAFERDGKETKLQGDTRAINTGNAFVVKRGDQVVAAGTMTLDPTTNPKASETTYTDGPDKGKAFKGIYRIDGDTTTFCRAGAPADDRPTEFKSKPGSGQFVAVYKRAK